MPVPLRANKKTGKKATAYETKSLRMDLSWKIRIGASDLCVRRSSQVTHQLHSHANAVYAQAHFCYTTHALLHRRKRICVLFCVMNKELLHEQDDWQELAAREQPVAHGQP